MPRSCLRARVRVCDLCLRYWCLYLCLSFRCAVPIVQVPGPSLACRLSVPVVYLCLSSECLSSTGATICSFRLSVRAGLSFSACILGASVCGARDALRPSIIPLTAVSIAPVLRVLRVRAGKRTRLRLFCVSLACVLAKCVRTPLRRLSRVRSSACVLLSSFGRTRTHHRPDGGCCSPTSLVVNSNTLAP